ncbi:YegS/Rv2252/BmrU family lipid kinase [Pleurocapsa sp. PCC 7319]|uniref:YegS/Rv2252/BmrU family lipid kinase n=1 Tax=Pleurocapsa sp. PCC 7319 TaxID=118161 RepID=UPI000345DA1D|nr:YegS/Rv2252/BmrU family lipid kinase [Pleurocapsa sp. PCC 7319]
MSRKACLIFNPVAGQGDSEQDLATIKSYLEPEFELEVQFTTKEIDGAELASQAVANGVETIIASGGDGTVSAVAGALIGTDIALGAISRGTANAFANALGIPDTIKAACDTILVGSTKKVDVGICNEKPLILLAGIGFEAETVEDADREAKDRLGILAYVLSGFKQLQKFTKFTAKIETKDKLITVEANAITIANAAPPSSVLAHGTAGVIFDDGLLDITILAPQTKTGAIATSFQLLQSASNKEAVDSDGVGYLRSEWIKVTTEPPQKVVLDGEIIGKTPIEVKCIPNGLNVFVPMEGKIQPKEKLDNLSGVDIELKQ